MALRLAAALAMGLASAASQAAPDAGARCDAVLAHVMGELGRQGVLRRTEFPSTPKETP
jgi:hypothetical protein